MRCRGGVRAAARILALLLTRHVVFLLRDADGDGSLRARILGFL